MRPFALPVELGGTRREDEERQASLLASQLELGSEFATAIHLQSGDGEGHAIDQRVQEVRGGERSGAFMHFRHIPTSDHVASREVFQHHSACRSQPFDVELHQIAGLLNGPKKGLSPGPGTTSHLPATVGYFRGLIPK
jgi:hypothetical protein